MRGDHAGKCYCWHLTNNRQFSIVISIENEGCIPKLPTVYPEQSSKGSERAQLTHMPESCSDQDIHDHASCKGKDNRKCKVQQKTLHSQNPIWKNLSQLYGKVVPNIYKFPVENLCHLPPHILFIHGNQLVCPAPKPDLLRVFQRIQTIQRFNPGSFLPMPRRPRQPQDCVHHIFS